jgi:hypothetical protein
MPFSAPLLERKWLFTAFVLTITLQGVRVKVLHGQKRQR